MSGDRCPTCGHLRREGEVQRALRKMLRGRNPPSMAEAARRLGVSRQRVHQIAKELGLRPRRKQEPAVTTPETKETTSEPAAHEHVGRTLGMGGSGILRQKCDCGATRRVVYGEPEEWSERS